MSFSGRVFTRWIQLAALASALSLMVYLAVQQVGRQTANDPQLQVARDASRAIAAGQSAGAITGDGNVELSASLAPWITITDDKGTIIASSARLHGAPRTVPPGVFDHARASGEERVTWQPEKGVRMATVVVHNRDGGFVVAGRSLLESEARTAAYGRMIMIGWLATLIGLLVVVSVTEAFVPRAAVAG